MGVTLQKVRRYRRGLLVGAVAILLALAYSQYWVLTGRFGTIVPGRLYRSAEMPPSRLVSVCRRHGITTVVDFREDRAKTGAEAAALARAGIAYVSIPSEQVPGAESVRAFLRVVDSRPDERMLIHCEIGVGRTGVFAAIYRMEYQGWSAFAATLEAMAYSGFASFYPGSDKARFLAAYAPRRGHGPR
jgi:protein tyrosine/serine phosphatase